MLPLHTLWKWIRHNWHIWLYPVLFFVGGCVWMAEAYTSGVFGFDSLLQWVVPPLGLLAGPAIAFYFRISPPFNMSDAYGYTFALPLSPSDRLLAFGILVVVSLLLGWLIWRGVRGIKHGRLRVILRNAFYANLYLGGIFIALILFVQIGQAVGRGTANRPRPLNSTPTRTCEYAISDTRMIRVEYFDNATELERGLSGVPSRQKTVFSITLDGGTTWRDFLIKPYSDNCDGIKSLNENFVWLWDYVGEFLIYTHDGQTWRSWKLSTVEGSEELDYRIRDVSFFDDQNGQMILEGFDHATQERPTITLHTTDGGATWIISADGS